MGFAQAADGAFLAGAGEGAGGVAEEFGLDEVFRQGGAVDGDEGAGPALAGLVHRLGEEFLADAGFAAQEQRDGLVGDASGLVGGALPAGVAGIEPAQGIAGFRGLGRGLGEAGPVGYHLDEEGLAVVTVHLEHLVAAPPAPVEELFVADLQQPGDGRRAPRSAGARPRRARPARLAPTIQPSPERATMPSATVPMPSAWACRWRRTPRL